MIDAKKITVRDLLDKSVQYGVPQNQRNFEWKKEQAEEFWEDISSGGTFLGTIVLDVNKEEKEKNILIVDGQQRLTTIFILLSACRNQAKKIKEIEQAQAIQHKLSFMDDTTGKSSKTKLVTSPSIRDVFEETITSYDWDGSKFNLKNKKRQANRIKPIYNYFSEKIVKYNQTKIQELLDFLYKSTIVKIEIQETREAFDIFERMNARGMELNAADLLKNYIFARKEIENIEDLEERWEVIVDNSIGNIVRMIKYFYVSKFGYIQKKKLFSAIKDYSETTGTKKMLNELESFSSLYQLIGNSTDRAVIEWATNEKINYFKKEYNAQSLNRVFDALSLFGVTQTYPIIIKSMSAISSVHNLKVKEKLAEKFLTSVEAIEKYHFINNAIAQRPGNEVEKYYADKCYEEIKTEKDINTFFNNINQDLSKKIVPKEEFIGRFTELNYEDDFILIYYIYDRMNNQEKKGGQYLNIYNPDKKILKRNYNIEHLIAQNTKEYDSILKDSKGDVLHNIGNLLVVSLHTNSMLGNKHIKDKFKILKEKEKLPEAHRFIKDWECKNWSSLDDINKNIIKRAETLGEKAYKEIWSF